MLTDDAAHGHRQPTRENILDAMRWLVQDACPHDSLVFHCESGRVEHGRLCDLS